MMSDATKLKMRLAKLGKKRPQWVVEKIRLATIKGMANPIIREKMRLVKLGKPSNHKGDKCTKESLDKMRIAHLGQKAWNKGLKGCYKQSPETIAKRVSKMKGKNNPAWKGGVTPENLKIRGSLETEIWRKAVFERDNYTCQKCGKKSGRLHAHHILNFAEYPKLRFVVDNGITFCKKSHNLFHKRYGIKHNTREQIKEFLNN